MTYHVGVIFSHRVNLKLALIPCPVDRDDIVPLKANVYIDKLSAVSHFM